MVEVESRVLSCIISLSCILIYLEGCLLFSHFVVKHQRSSKFLNRITLHFSHLIGN